VALTLDGLDTGAPLEPSLQIVLSPYRQSHKTMHVSFLDPYRPRPSIIHGLDARVKLVLALAFILATALTPAGAWPVYILLFAWVFSVELLSELGVRSILQRTLLAAPFVLAALPVLVTTRSAPLLAVPLGPWTLTVTGPGLEKLLSIMAKSWISVQMAIVLSATTPFPDLLLAMRAIRIPRLLVAVFGLMWRYLFVLADEALRLLRARTARSGGGYAWLGQETGQSRGESYGKVGGTLAWRARVTGGMAGSLFLRSFERADRIYAAMAARGYDGEVRSFPLPPISPVAWGVLVAGLSALALLTVAGFLFWG
jgi:cobalt/nickel transport system permease protein